MEILQVPLAWLALSILYCWIIFLVDWLVENCTLRLEGGCGIKVFLLLFLLCFGLFFRAYACVYTLL